MKKTYLLLITLISFALSGCTQADGNIGEWFGSWYLEEMEINGETDANYQSIKDKNQGIMISFQGKLFKLGYIDGLEIYGQWEYAGEILTLIAEYKAGSGYGQPQFDPFPKEMLLPAGVDQAEITVTSHKSRTMQWQYIDQNGDLLTYNFKKYP